MTTDIITRLRAAIAAGPMPGPWMHLFGDRLIYTKLGDGCKGEAVARVDWISGPSYLATLSFIAAASPDNIAALLDRLEAAERENERLRLFCGKVLGTSRDTMSDVYGGDVQDWALDCGLLEERSVIEPCGEGCRCAEVADFPLKCCFYTPLGEACIDAAMAAEQSDEV